MIGKTDARILYSNCPTCDGYEIVIGGWENTQSALRERKQNQDNEQNLGLTMSTPNLLSETEWRRFWVTYVEDNTDNTVTFT